MMGFRAWLAEEEAHKDGTYINVKLDQTSKDELYSWVVANNINNPLAKDEYHTTVIYSPTPCPEAAGYDFKLPATGTICGWKIFDAPIGRCLVAHVNSADLQRINADLKRDYGATSTFPDYIPHITVSYSYKGELPTAFPAVNISFERVEVKGIDKNWRPSK